MRLGSIVFAAILMALVAVWVLSGQEEPTPMMAVQVGDDAPENSQAGALRPAVDVLVLDSSAETLESRQTLRGITEAGRRVDAKAETEGLVTTERRNKGAAVSKGDLLCRLDLGERPAQLAEARARLAQAEADANASTKLSSRGYSAETKLAADLAMLEAAKAAVSRIERDIARTEIVAPFDGLLETDTADLGALLLPGSTCATVVALDPIRVVGHAPERIVGALAPGMTAAARLVTGFEFEAKVTYVSRWADVETRTYRIEAEAPNPDGAIRDGMTTEMSISLESGTAHMLPSSALTLDAEGRLGVRLSVEETGDDGQMRHVSRFAPVETLDNSKEGVWVSGLPEKATVIVLGQEFVTDGARVTPHYSLEDAAGAAARAEAQTQ